MHYIPLRLKILGFLLISVTTFAWIMKEDVQVYEEPQRLSFGVDEDGRSADLADRSRNYDELDALLADITSQLHQQNVSKDDILRGWYLANENERRYGTPDTWIFIEDGENSKWISPNAIEEIELVTSRELCKQTAGQYIASCLETTDSECEFVGESVCSCPHGTKWKDEQGCILTTERGSYLAINSLELNQGWYLGLPSEKKLNTPPDWKWHEAGRESSWRRP